MFLGLNPRREEIRHPLHAVVELVVLSLLLREILDSFGGTIDFLEGNVTGKVFCGIACGMAGDEFCFTAKEGKDVCDVPVSLSDALKLEELDLFAQEG